MKLKTSTDTNFNNMDIIANESHRVAYNPKEILAELDAEFEKQIGLNKTDIKFLFFATALQIGRWIVINKINQNVTKKLMNHVLKIMIRQLKNGARSTR